MELETARDWDRMERAIRFLDREQEAQPDLEAVARVMGLSPWHAQRVFTRWAGVSPKQFLGLLTVEAAKARLRATGDVLGTALDVGLSGPSRLHDLFVKLEAMTPGQYRAQGAGMVLRWGIHPTPFGDAILVLAERGLVRLEFATGRPAQELLDGVRADWPLSRLVADPAATAPVAARVFAGLREGEPLAVMVKGTPFQVQVWRALLRIPEGAVVSYGALARALGKPGASRAVGSACGLNRIGWLVPCHRVIRETGALGGYHGGLPLKRAILAWEAARTEAAA